MNENIINGAKRKHIKLIFQCAFFASLIILAMIYVLKDDPKAAFEIVLQANFFPLLLAIAILILSIFFDGLNITILAKLYNPRYRYYQGIINVSIGQVLGVFIKSAACIPQAMTFPKQDIKSPQAASILTMNYLLYQFSLFIFSLFVVFFGYPYVKDIPIELLGGLSLFYLCLIALSVQFVVLLVIFFLGFSRGLHRLVLNNGIDILKKLHLLRDADETRRKLTLQFATYRVELKRLFQHKFSVVIIIISNLIKLFLLTSIPYFIFMSLNADTSLLSFDTSLFITGYVNTISSLISVGVPEVMFQSAFSFYLPSEASSLASASNILWRSITFYLLFIIGLLTLLLYKGAPKKREILFNTKTIYDMGIENIINSDDKTKEYLSDIKFEKRGKTAPLLSKKQVETSFNKLRNHMIEKSGDKEEESIELPLQEVLERNRKSLAKIEHEVAMILDQEKPDQEIQLEAQKEIELQKEKSERKKKRQVKKEEKMKKRLLKLQPKGTTIKEGEDGTIIYTFEHEVTEYISLPTGESEDEK